jgi:hypothetical protein
MQPEWRARLWLNLFISSSASFQVQPRDQCKVTKVLNIHSKLLRFKAISNQGSTPKARHARPSFKPRNQTHDPRINPQPAVVAAPSAKKTLKALTYHLLIEPLIYLFSLLSSLVMLSFLGDSLAIDPFPKAGACPISFS